MIAFHDVCKTYRVAKRGAGLGNAAKSLFKREYSMIHAINHVSFSINDGEMIGLLGPNGAGKSSQGSVNSSKGSINSSQNSAHGALESSPLQPENEDSGADLDHIIAGLYEKLNIL